MLPALAFLANPAFWSGAGNAAGAASGLAGLFGIGKKKSGGQTLSPEAQIPGFQLQAGKSLADWVQQYLPNYKPGEAYTGNFTAPMTDIEKGSLTSLQKFLSAPNTGDLFGSTYQNLLDTQSGKFANPMTSPFIQAMTNLSKMNLSDAINTSRRGAGARGSFFSDSAIRDEGVQTNKSLANLDAIIGDFTNQERGRQLQAAPLAFQADKYLNFDAPLAKVGAAQEFGSLPRLIEQADLEAKYNDFKRQRLEMAKPVDAAQSLFGTKTPYGLPEDVTMPTQESNPLASILGMISKLNLSSMGGNGDILSKLAGLFKTA